MWKEFQSKYCINEQIISVIEDMGFDKITKVQNVVIPHFIKNRDVIVKSCTGSGKTLSYLIPIFQKLLETLKKENEIRDIDFNSKNNSIQNKILSIIFLPTRELAMQVNNILSKFIQKLPFTLQLVMGGTDLKRDLDKLNKEIPNIFVATPGRLNDLDEKLSFDFKNLNILILDEADKMLELGYGKQLTYLVSKFPKQRRTGLFSATINSQIENMIKIGMQNPIFVDIKINLNNMGRNDYCLSVEDSNKIELLNNKNKIVNIKNKVSKNNIETYKKNNIIQEDENLFNENITNNNEQGGVNLNSQNKIEEFNKLIKDNILEDNQNILVNEEIFIKSVEEDINKYSKVILLDSITDKMEELINFNQEVPDQLKQFYIDFNNIQDKFPYLIYFIKNFYTNNSKIIIFFATCNCVEYYAIVLPKIFENIKEDFFKFPTQEKINFFKLHSKINQKKRNQEYKNFLTCQNGILLSTDLSARGIDVPNVDVIIQYDPPKNEEIYIHRVGRTARVGRQGQSIIFISNEETSFINYMKQKKVLIDNIRDEDEINKINEKNNNYIPNFKFYTNLDFNLEEKIFLKNEIFQSLKNINLSDKWIYDKAVKALISLIRFYQEHDLKYIFDVKRIDIGNLANSFKLLRLPRIKEIIGKKVENFVQDNEINPKMLAYQDFNIAKQMIAKEEKQQRLKDDRQIKREQAKIQEELGKRNRTKKEKKQAKIRNAYKDWDEFADEEKLYKKYKQGKITKEEYDKLFLKNL